MDSAVFDDVSSVTCATMGSHCVGFVVYKCFQQLPDEDSREQLLTCQQQHLMKTTMTIENFCFLASVAGNAGMACGVSAIVNGFILSVFDKYLFKEFGFHSFCQCCIILLAE